MPFFYKNGKVMLEGILFMSGTTQDVFYVYLPTFSTLQRALWVQQVLDVCVESGKPTKSALLPHSANESTKTVLCF